MITQIKSALVSGFIMSLFAMISYVLSVGNIFEIDYYTLANIGVLALLTSIVSMSKNVLTTENGTFLGVVKVR